MSKITFTQSEFEAARRCIQIMVDHTTSLDPCWTTLIDLHQRMSGDFYRLRWEDIMILGVWVRVVLDRFDSSMANNLALQKAINLNYLAAASVYDKLEKLAKIHGDKIYASLPSIDDNDLFDLSDLPQM